MFGQDRPESDRCWDLRSRFGADLPVVRNQRREPLAASSSHRRVPVSTCICNERVRNVSTMGSHLLVQQFRLAINVTCKSRVQKAGVWKPGSVLSSQNPSRGATSLAPNAYHAAIWGFLSIDR
jgi:hypothetical protein